MRPGLHGSSVPFSREREPRRCRGCWLTGGALVAGLVLVLWLVLVTRFAMRWDAGVRGPTPEGDRAVEDRDNSEPSWGNADPVRGLRAPGEPWTQRRSRLLLVGILSRPTASDQRALVRRTWLQLLPPECFGNPDDVLAASGPDEGAPETSHDRATDAWLATERVVARDAALAPAVRLVHVWDALARRCRADGPLVEYRFLTEPFASEGESDLFFVPDGDDSADSGTAGQPLWQGSGKSPTGGSSNTAGDGARDAEEARVGLLRRYRRWKRPKNSLAFKFRAFLRAGMPVFDPAFVLRVDDDGFLSLARLVAELLWARPTEKLVWSSFHAPPKRVRGDENFLLVSRDVARFLAFGHAAADTSASSSASSSSSLDLPSRLAAFGLAGSSDADAPALQWTRSLSQSPSGGSDHTVLAKARAAARERVRGRRVVRPEHVWGEEPFSVDPFTVAGLPLHVSFGGGSTLGRWLSPFDLHRFHDGRLWQAGERLEPDITTDSTEDGQEAGSETLGLTSQFLYCHKCGAGDATGAAPNPNGAAAAVPATTSKPLGSVDPALWQALFLRLSRTSRIARLLLPRSEAGFLRNVVEPPVTADRADGAGMGSTEQASANPLVTTRLLWGVDSDTWLRRALAHWRSTGLPMSHFGSPGLDTLWAALPATVDGAALRIIRQSLWGVPPALLPLAAAWIAHPPVENPGVALRTLEALDIAAEILV